MKVIILAAGQGSRLGHLTENKPKCMIELVGKTILARQLEVFHQLGINDITVVGGHQADKIQLDGSKLLLNKKYATTNMVSTFFCASDQFADDNIIISYGDIVFEERVLTKLISSNAQVAVTIDRGWKKYWEARMDNPLVDAETLKMNSAGHITEIGKKPKHYDDIEAQYIGLIKFNNNVLGKLKDAYYMMDQERLYDGKTFENMYMTSFLQHLIDLGWAIHGVPILNGWLEVDTLDDLSLYDQLWDNGMLHSFYNAGS